MQNSLDKIKERLQQGGWTFDLIWPAFRQSLEKKISQKGLPFPFLTANYYRQLEIPKNWEPKIKENPFCVIDSSVGEGVPFWNVACEVVFKGTKLGTFPKGAEVQIRHALSEIELAFPTLKKDFETYSNCLVVYQGEDRAKYDSGSQPHFAGALFMHERTLLSPTLSWSLVHEMAHQELFGLNLADRLVTEVGDDHWEFAPFQKESRPTLGRFHAAFALYRTIQLNEKIGKSTAEEKQLLLQTLSTFRDGDLTYLGEFITKIILLVEAQK